jgi:hypothetical protein
MFLVLAAAGQLQPRAGLSVVECAARRPVGETAECIRSASTAELLQQGHAGQTVLHVLVGSLASFKAGDFSRLEAWSNPGDTTRYRHDVTNRLAQTIDPLVAEVLQKAPELSKMANSAGTTPLHLCALVGAQRVTRLLLDAGASPLANSNEGRTPIDDAMRMGQTELLAMMLNSLSGQARQEQEERAAQFASLPGSPLIPSILKDSGLRHLPRAPPRLDPPPSMTSVSGAACAEGGGWDVAPEPSEEQRTSCDIDQRDPSLGADEYMTDYFSKGRPVLIRNAVPLSDRCGLARDVGPMRAAQQVRSPCGRTAYPSLTGQDFCGRFSYLDLNAHPACADKGHTLPICVRKPGGGSASINVSGSIWKQLPACFRYEASVPPMPVLARPWVSAGAHQLFAGGNGSGAALHFHSAAYNAVFFGTKHWLLTPPRYAGISGAASTVWRDSHAPRDLPRGAEMPFRCTQGPGDIVVVPNHWGHATVNEAFSIGIGDLFCDSLLSSLVSDVRCARPFAAMQAQPPVQRLADLWNNLTGRATPLSGKMYNGRGAGRGSAAAGLAARRAAASAGDGGGGAPGSGAGERAPTDRRSLRAVDALLEGARSHSTHRRPLVSSVHSPGSGSDAPHGSLASIRPRGPSPLGAGGASRPVRQPPAAGCEKGAANYSTVAFVHVNKAGGTMMRAALLTYAGHQLLETGAADAVSKLRSVGARFFHASGSLQQWAVGQAAWVKAYKFALVRNPWSRQVRTGKRAQPHRLVTWLYLAAHTSWHLPFCNAARAPPAAGRPHPSAIPPRLPSSPRASPRRSPCFTSCCRRPAANAARAPPTATSASSPRRDRG